MPKHSERPWGQRRDWATGGTVILSDATPVALVYQADTVEGRANANVIEVAPDFLFAAKAALVRLTSLNEQGDEETCALLRDLISRAEG